MPAANTIGRLRTAVNGRACDAATPAVVSRPTSVAVSKPRPNSRPDRCTCATAATRAGTRAPNQRLMTPPGSSRASIGRNGLAAPHRAKHADDVDEHDEIQDADDVQEQARDGRADERPDRAQVRQIGRSRPAPPRRSPASAPGRPSSGRARRRSRRRTAGGRRPSACASCCRWRRCGRRRTRAAGRTSTPARPVRARTDAHGRKSRRAQIPARAERRRCSRNG